MNDIPTNYSNAVNQSASHDNKGLSIPAAIVHNINPAEMRHYAGLKQDKAYCPNVYLVSQQIPVQATPNAANTPAVNVADLIKALESPPTIFGGDSLKISCSEAAKIIRGKTDWTDESFNQVRDSIKKTENALKTRDDLFHNCTGSQKFAYKAEISRLNELIEVGLVGPNRKTPEQIFKELAANTRFDFQDYDKFSNQLSRFERVLIEMHNSEAWGNFSRYLNQIILSEKYSQKVGIDLLIYMQDSSERAAELQDNKISPVIITPAQHDVFSQALQKILQLDSVDFPNENPTDDEVYATQNRNGEIGEMRSSVQGYMGHFIRITRQMQGPYDRDALLALCKIDPLSPLKELVNKGYPGMGQKLADYFRTLDKQENAVLRSSDSIGEYCFSMLLKDSPLNHEQALLVADMLMRDTDLLPRPKIWESIPSFEKGDRRGYEERLTEARQILYLHLQKYPESNIHIRKAVDAMAAEEQDPVQCERIKNYSEALKNAAKAGISRPLLFQADTLIHLVKNNLSSPSERGEQCSLIIQAGHDPAGIVAYCNDYVKALMRNGNTVFFVESSDKDTFIDKPIRISLNGRFPFQNAIVLSHGDSALKRMILGSEEGQPVTPDYKPYLEREDREEFLKRQFGCILSKDGTLVLASCSAGKQENGDSMADTFVPAFKHAAHLLAPKADIHPDIEYIFNENGKIEGMKCRAGEVNVLPKNVEQAMANLQKVIEDLLNGRGDKTPVAIYDPLKK